MADAEISLPNNKTSGIDLPGICKTGITLSQFEPLLVRAAPLVFMVSFHETILNPFELREK